MYRALSCSTASNLGSRTRTVQQVSLLSQSVGAYAVHALSVVAAPRMSASVMLSGEHSEVRRNYQTIAVKFRTVEKSVSTCHPDAGGLFDLCFCY